jgi:hypothetical protein
VRATVEHRLALGEGPHGGSSLLADMLSTSSMVLPRTVTSSVSLLKRAPLHAPQVASTSGMMERLLRPIGDATRSARVF